MRFEDGAEPPGSPSNSAATTLEELDICHDARTSAATTFELRRPRRSNPARICDEQGKFNFPLVRDLRVSALTARVGDLVVEGAGTVTSRGVIVSIDARTECRVRWDESGETKTHVMYDFYAHEVEPEHGELRLDMGEDHKQHVEELQKEFQEKAARNKSTLIDNERRFAQRTNCADAENQLRREPIAQRTNCFHSPTEDKLSSLPAPFFGRIPSPTEDQLRSVFGMSLPQLRSLSPPISSASGGKLPASQPASGLFVGAPASLASTGSIFGSAGAPGSTSALGGGLSAGATPSTTQPGTGPFATPAATSTTVSGIFGPISHNTTPPAPEEEEPAAVLLMSARRFDMTERPNWLGIKPSSFYDNPSLSRDALSIVGFESKLELELLFIAGFDFERMEGSSSASSSSASSHEKKRLAIHYNLCHHSREKHYFFGTQTVFGTQKDLAVGRAIDELLATQDIEELTSELYPVCTAASVERLLAEVSTLANRPGVVNLSGIFTRSAVGESDRFYVGTEAAWQRLEREDRGYLGHRRSRRKATECQRSAQEDSD